MAAEKALARIAQRKARLAPKPKDQPKRKPTATVETTAINETSEPMPSEVKFEDTQSDLQGAIEGLMKRKADSVKAFKDEVAEAHKAFDIVDGMSAEVRNAVSGFRAWLAGKTNGPHVEEVSPPSSAKALPSGS
jgi:hypothetical protein